MTFDILDFGAKSYHCVETLAIFNFDQLVNTISFSSFLQQRYLNFTIEQCQFREKMNLRIGRFCIL